MPLVKRALRWLLRSLLAVLVLATGAGLTSAARTFEVASPGEATDYWAYLCGVQLPGFSGHSDYSYSGGVYPEVDGLLYYYDQRHHDQLLYAVSPADVLSALPLVREHLES